MTRPTAISKNEALTQLTAEVENILAKAMPVINAKLMNFTAGSNRIVYVSSLGFDRIESDVKARAIEEIRKEYTAQGWTVKFTYGDQRDNDNSQTFS